MNSSSNNTNEQIATINHDNANDDAHEQELLEPLPTHNFFLDDTTFNHNDAFSLLTNFISPQEEVNNETVKQQQHQQQHSYESSSLQATPKMNKDNQNNKRKRIGRPYVTKRKLN